MCDAHGEKKACLIEPTTAVTMCVCSCLSDFVGTDVMRLAFKVRTLIPMHRLVWTFSLSFRISHRVKFKGIV